MVYVLGLDMCAVGCQLLNVSCKELWLGTGVFGLELVAYNASKRDMKGNNNYEDGLLR